MKPHHELFLVVDIETVALDDVANYVDAPLAPANYRDPAKIASYIQEKTADQIEKAALDPDLSRIVAIGWQLEAWDDDPIVWLCEDEDTERRALVEFWKQIALEQQRTRRLLTFNGFGFDLPTLMRRSVYLECWPSRFLSCDKYRSPHLDLLQKLTFNGAIRAHSLRFYANRFRLLVDAPELTGADIAARVAAGDWTAVRAHCASDVDLTYRLAARLRYLEYDEDDDRERDEAVS